MAGAAGFEPAVPGLGGQCIIQAMLHARLPQSLLPKKPSVEKHPFSILYIRCHQARKALRTTMDERNSLPTPYGEGSSFVPANERALSRAIARRDAGRRFWVWASMAWPTPGFRMMLSAVAIISSAILLVGWRYSSIELSIFSFVALSVMYVPTNLAAWYSSMVARDRLSLRVEGHTSKLSLIHI